MSLTRQNAASVQASKLGTAARLRRIDTAFRAANYLGAAQIYLKSNPLLRKPLTPDDIKPRLLGHWGTQPGLNLVYMHLNRLIQDTGANVLYIAGTGHGAPAVLACLWLEGTMGEVYPDFGQDLDGLTRFVRAFSWPGGLPSHLTALTPGAIHEGGELGYSLLHAFGAAFDNPDLLVACIVGDGEAETGPLAASWHSTKFLDPRRDGAVLPILHLNGYKLSGPSIFARMGDDDLTHLFEGYGYEVLIVSGDDPDLVHPALWSALDRSYQAIRAIQDRSRSGGATRLPPRWPMIVLRTLKGWTGPKSLDGKPIEGTFHSHQVPIEEPRTNPEHLKAVEAWLRSYRPQELFAEDGRPRPETVAIYPAPELRMGRNPHANGGALLKPLNLPDYAVYAVDVPTPSAVKAEGTSVLGRLLRDVFRENADAANFRLFCPDETTSNRLGAVFEATQRAFEEPMVPTDEHLSRDGRVMEILSEHCCEGWLEGYLQTGRHGIFACYEAFIGIVDSMMAQYAKWQKMADEISWRRPVASLNYLLTSHVWEQDHNGYSHQGPTFINMMMTKKSSQIRIYLPPDANCLLSVADHCLRTRDHINLIVASKKPQPQWLDLEAARAHCARGASVWPWASNDAGAPDVVFTGIGDVPTREIVVAAWLLRRDLPDLKVRVVNVVDLLALESKGDHPHAMPPEAFAGLFTEDRPVIVAFHGYPLLIHELIYRRPDPQRFHVHGYREEGTTTTPFDMLVLNGMSRYHLAIAALQWVEQASQRGADLIRAYENKLVEHHAYVVEHGEDMPEIMNWQWTSSFS